MNVENIDKDVLLKLDFYLEDLKTKWDETAPPKKSWFTIHQTQIAECTKFLICALDDLILFVQENIPKGSDKKAVVLLVISKIFDYVATNSFPAWLIPLTPVVKQIIVGVIVSQLIEFIVSKYRDGSWRVTANQGGI
jgi:hypothetical protein